ncbi:MAG: protein-glutamate O-methyltransferase CheR [Spartobacteria bacterium]|nr:protein-glutamate O-methyltransferase CheR [Spartobacteria bacterium]
MNISQVEFDLLRGYIQEHCGILVGDEKSYLIESRLAQLVVENGCTDFRQFYQKAKNDTAGTLRDKIIDAMTTNETLWFRDGGPWALLREVILPEFIETLASGKKHRIRIWSAACSTGQEPYSIAMLLEDILSTPAGHGVRAEQFEIMATDISPSALFLAISGRYNQIAISRGLDQAHRDRYFEKKGAVWELKQTIRKRISFKQFNLQHSLAPLGSFDMVLCRNVAIYFSSDFKKDLFARIANVLHSTEGYLLMGSTESLIGYTDAFNMLDKRGVIYYKVK